MKRIVDWIEAHTCPKYGIPGVVRVHFGNEEARFTNHHEAQPCDDTKCAHIAEAEACIPKDARGRKRSQAESQK